MVFMACVLLFIAGYAQARIPRYTTGHARILLTRLVLIGAGIGCGYVLAVTSYAPANPLALIAFLIGFGAVHFPAAVILFVKQQRAAGKS